MTRPRRWWKDRQMRRRIRRRLSREFLIWRYEWDTHKITTEWIYGRPDDERWSHHFVRFNDPAWLGSRLRPPYLAAYDGQIHWLTDQVEAVERMRIVADVAALECQA